MLFRNTHTPSTHTQSQTCKRGCTKDTRWLSVCGLFNTNYVGEHKTSPRCSERRDYITVARINMQTLKEQSVLRHAEKEYTHLQLHTVLLIHSLVIIISGRKKKRLTALRRQERPSRRGLLALPQKGWVRSHTGFIMTEACEGGQEPFLSPLLTIHASWGTRSLPSGHHKRPTFLY